METAKAFGNYHWPGNIGELRNIIERAMILENEDYIFPEHLPVEILSFDAQHIDASAAPISMPAGGLDIEEVERELIKQALDLAKWNQTRAARLLNLTRDALRYRMQKFGFLLTKT